MKLYKNVIHKYDRQGAVLAHRFNESCNLQTQMLIFFHQV